MVSWSHVRAEGLSVAVRGAAAFDGRAQGLPQRSAASDPVPMRRGDVPVDRWPVAVGSTMHGVVTRDLSRVKSTAQRLHGQGRLRSSPQVTG